MRIHAGAAGSRSRAWREVPVSARIHSRKAWVELLYAEGLVGAVERRSWNPEDKRWWSDGDGPRRTGEGASIPSGRHVGGNWVQI